MNIDNITIKEAREIASLFSGHVQPIEENYGRVVCQFIGRFLFVADMKISGGYCYLTNVLNIRYWSERENGLGDLAVHGKQYGDNIDKWPDQIIPVDKLGPFMKANAEHWNV